MKSTIKRIVPIVLLACLCAKDSAQPNATNDFAAQAEPAGVRIVLFTPADVTAPAGAKARLTKIAEACEHTFLVGMKRCGYPPAVTNLFRREADGMVEVLEVRGEEPAASGKYTKPDYADYVIKLATEKYSIKSQGNIWWIFVFLGDRPARFNDFRGGGNFQAGGHAMVNYDSIAGDIRPDLGLAEGFNAEFFLKGCIHELGHAFGLPHIGPDVFLGLGNTLMGPTTAAYTQRKLPHPEKVYLDEASAAMLWKHPFFSGSAKDRSLRPTVKMTGYKAVFVETNDSVIISGRLVASLPAHSVVIMDDQGRPRNEYWFRGYVARISPNGDFQVNIPKPPRAGKGEYWILFCFDNGAVTGTGKIAFGKESAIRKSYHFEDGKFQFDD